MSKKYNVLILGASYGSLLASKMLMAGHNATLVCLPAEAEPASEAASVPPEQAARARTSAPRPAMADFRMRSP